MKQPKNIKLEQKVFFNKRTGQPSIILPKKILLKFFGKMPKKITLVIKNIK